MIKIIHANTVGLELGFFDVMITDPPYSDHVHKNAVSQSVGGGVRKRDLGFDHLTPELRRRIAVIAGNLVKRWSLIYSDVEGIHDWKNECEEVHAEYIRPIPWIRWSMPQLSGDRPPTGCEFVIAFWGTARGRKSWNGPGNLISLNHTCLRGDGKHKTEKPLDQMLDLVTYFSNPGEHVLDVCCGSGTTGLACRLLGRPFTGVEIDKEWAEKAKDRILTEKLSDRDAERFERWKESQEKAWEDKKRREKNTNKVRAQLEAKKRMPVSENTDEYLEKVAKGDIISFSGLPKAGTLTVGPPLEFNGHFDTCEHGTLGCEDKGDKHWCEPKETDGDWKEFVHMENWKK